MLLKNYLLTRLYWAKTDSDSSSGERLLQLTFLQCLLSWVLYKQVAVWVLPLSGSETLLCWRHAPLFQWDPSVYPATWLTSHRKGHHAGSAFWMRQGMWVESPKSGRKGNWIAKRNLIILIKWSTWFAFQVLQLFCGNPGVFPWQYFYPWWGSRKWADSSSNVTGQHPGQSQNSSGKTAWEWKVRAIGKGPGYRGKWGRFLTWPWVVDWEVQGIAPGENVCFLKPHSVFWKPLSTCERFTITVVPTYITPPLLFSQVVPSFLTGLNEDKYPREAAELGWEERAPDHWVLAIIPEHRVDCQLRVCTASVPFPSLQTWTVNGETLYYSVVFVNLAALSHPVSEGCCEALQLRSCSHCRVGQFSHINLTPMVTP